MQDLYIRTKEFALLIVKLYVNLPKSTEAQVLGKQLLRAGTSIGAHYKETGRARSKAEFVAKIGIALQELDESIYWMELLVGTKLTATDNVKDLFREANELIAIFVTISNNINRK